MDEYSDPRPACPRCDATDYRPFWDIGPETVAVKCCECGYYYGRRKPRNSW